MLWFIIYLYLKENNFFDEDVKSVLFEATYIYIYIKAIC